MMVNNDIISKLCLRETLNNVDKIQKENEII